MPSSSPVYDALSPLCHHRLQEFGQRLRQARQRREWTQEQLAAKAGYSLGTLKKIEAGDPRVPIGFWLQTMDVFKLADELNSLAMPHNDSVGSALEPKAVRKRVRRSAEPVEFDLGDD